MPRAKMRAAREERGLSQGRLAALARTSQSAVARFEAGTVVPPADVALLLSEALGLTIRELLEESDEPARTRRPSTVAA